jgi:hypothetical protein
MHDRIGRIKKRKTTSFPMLDENQIKDIKNPQTFYKVMLESHKLGERLKKICLA